MSPASHSPGRVVILRGDAASLPLADESVDLVVTSPPYFGLRSYSDNGEHYAGQIGSEATPGEFTAALLACTREWMRVLKPQGSIFVNLGDKYSDRGHGPNRGHGTSRGPQAEYLPQTRGPMEKSLLGLPWRYALGCVDDLGLILRAEIVWQKPNGLPESVADRVRRSHEQVFHFVRQPRYYSAVDEVREGYAPGDAGRTTLHKQRGLEVLKHHPGNQEPAQRNPLGKLPGSVWEIPSQPLTVPAYLGVDHFAAFPMELPRRIIRGWSPPGICLGCREGRFPVTAVANVEDRKGRVQRIVDFSLDAAHGQDGRGGERWKQTVRITGHACACTPYTDHAGTGEPSGPYGRHADAVAAGTYENVGAGWGGKSGLGDRPRVGPWREYHLDGWDAPPTRPAIVLDPFGGTGTSALVASVLGRTGITVDRSADYCRLAAWRTSDPAERARALGVPKPPPVMSGQGDLFDQEAS